MARRTASSLACRDRSRHIDRFWQRISSALMRGVADQLNVVHQVRVEAAHEEPCRLVGGPASAGRLNPLVDDLGNLLPEALPLLPQTEEWERDPGPLHPDELWMGPLRIRVRPPSSSDS